MKNPGCSFANSFLLEKGGNVILHLLLELVVKELKYLRFKHCGTEYYGILEGDQVKPVEGSIFENCKVLDESWNLADVELLAPCMPSKIVAVGLNYHDHIKEFGDREVPKNPTLFIKLPHTVIAPEQPILIPEIATRVDYEAELAIVIGKYCKNVSVDEAMDYVFGATCLNDVTERNIQKSDGQWTRGKNFETFCPIGPYIVDGLDYGNLEISSRLNGEIRQHSNTSLLIWNVSQLVSFISEVIPLYPGDIVSTGTPMGVSPMKDGDRIEVTVAGIGTLANPVKNAG
jgi:2-keto-4-pentenoate hydratase/2-oxohepta-3-ene-1,7-dioic acid hydratase in catechol pathway